MEPDSVIVPAGADGADAAASRLARLEERVLELEPRVLDLESDHAYHQRALEDYDDEFYRLEQRMVRIEEALSRLMSAMKEMADSKQGPLPPQERPPHY
jgi:uncharacterized coiled-coil protein SlyX